ncbi:hypothetical protein [Sediminicoccus sp. BL-A-41-H5]|uniref:hypothetical protein n=1 Tax=Sediminicoccus sp. BL-A-41-H5 TaxID=3421106 RepID=UPI003D66E0CB
MFSERWLYVSGLRLTLRRRLQATPRRIAGELWYLVSDPLTNEHARVPAQAWRFLKRLGPDRSVGEAWEEAYRSGEAASLTQPRIVSLISTLYQRNLLTFAAPNDSVRLAERGRKRNSKPLVQRLQSIFFLPIPLLDPDRALRRAAPLLRLIFGPFGLALWVVVLMAGLTTLVSQWGRVQDASASVFAAPDPIALFLAFLLGKALHELAHAGMCRRFGGPVHTLGVMMIVFAPLPYVDVSSAWAFASRAQRIAVGSAGMAMDLFIGALATIAWAETPPGAFNDAAFSLMLTSATYTLLFNANPLMRFDGYYMLSDLLETPNLSARGSAALAEFFRRHIMGQHRRLAADEADPLHGGIACYGAAALAYRLFAIGGITMFLADLYYGAGFIAAVILATGGLLVPFLTFLQRERANSAGISRSGTRLWWLGGSAAGLLALIALLPLPDWSTLPAGIEGRSVSEVTAASGGRLEAILAEPNISHPAGTPLLRLADPELLLERQSLRQQLTRNALMERRALTDGGADLEPIRERRRSLEALLHQTETDIAALTIRAPTGGIWAAPEIHGRMHGWIERGTELGMMLPPDGFRVVALVPQTESARIARATLAEAGLRCGGTAGHRLQATELRLVPHAVERLPNAALGSAGGGGIAVLGHDPGGTAAAEPVFRLEGRISGADAHWLHHGRACRLRITLPDRPLLTGWIEGLRQFLQRRYRL